MAVIEGAAVGAGLSRSLHATCASSGLLCTDRTVGGSFGTIAGGGGPQRLTKLIGPGGAKRMMLAAELA